MPFTSKGNLQEFQPERDGVSVRRGGFVPRAEAGGDSHAGGIAIEDPQACTRHYFPLNA